MILRCLAAAAAVLLLAVQPALAQQSTILRNPTNTAPFGTEANPIVVGGGILGATGENACATDNGACSIAALIKRNNQRVTSMITALGSPLQAGGSVGISGTLPAFASAPTFNLGTLNGAATAANQATANTALAAIQAAAESPDPVSVTLAACTPYGFQSGASTNATNVKSSAATLCGGTAINTTATVYYLRLYNSPSAPTCSSATGFVATVPIPASTTGNGAPISFGSVGASFPAGLSFCLTGGGTSADNTSAATGVFLTLGYR